MFIRSEAATFGVKTPCVHCSFLYYDWSQSVMEEDDEDGRGTITIVNWCSSLFFFFGSPCATSSYGVLRLARIWKVSE